MVQRYTYDQIFGITPDVEGVLVLYEDYAKLESAVIALLADINRRYPGEGFKCPLILKLAEIVGHEPCN